MPGRNGFCCEAISQRQRPAESGSSVARGNGSNVDIEAEVLVGAFSSSGAGERKDDVFDPRWQSKEPAENHPKRMVLHDRINALLKVATDKHAMVKAMFEDT